MTPEEAKKNQYRVACKIKALGIGAGPKWCDIATAAMTGHQESIKAVEEMLEREAKTLLDLAIVQGAAYDAMTWGERKTMYAEASRALKNMTSAAPLGPKYLDNKLSDLRRAKGLTQAQLAQKAGVSLSILQKLENGSVDIMRSRTAITLRLATALETTVENLVK